MLKFGLWWVRWDKDTGTYESRMTVGSRKATVGDFKERDFDRIVVLSGEGRGIKYSGRGYGNGYMDGLHFAHWVLSEILGNVKYYITIPFSDKSGNLRDNPANGFNGSYWAGWIDGVLNVYDPRRIGFYWSYESCLQATINDPAVKVLGISDKEQYKEAYIQFIEDMSNYIHNHGLELIWIPATGGRGVTYLRKGAFDGILKIGGYFDYVFVQPNYYEYPECIEYINDTKQQFPYSYEKLVEKIRFIHEELTEAARKQNPHTTVSIEMEADSAVLPDQCGHCALCEYKNKQCVKCDNEGCLERACDYYRAIMEVNPNAFSTRAYYFGTDLRVVDKVRGRCPGW
ncbi:DUF4855 domain-containing protein [Thermococcus sp.]|uniref:DUF4855 domain-containing protein n=1 Tax=Thermococcus sp. TaxID=35749 RepID=UPI0026147A94|nr:DUF4855 domain-containing protein [Thermococcus sp.]